MEYMNASNYFHPDGQAEYAETHVINLSRAQASVARYPNLTTSS